MNFKSIFIRIFDEKPSDEQVIKLYKNLRLSSLAIIAISFLITLFLIKVENWQIVLWFLIITIINLYRYRLAYNFSPKNCQCKKAYRTFLILLIASSFTFGSIFIFYMPHKIYEQFLLLMVFSGVISAGVTQVAYTKIAIRLFLLATIIPTVISFILLNEPLHYIFAISIIFYFLFMSRIGVNIYEQYKEVLNLYSQYTLLMRRFHINNQRMKHLFENTPIGVFYYNRDLVVTFLNDYLADNIIRAPKDKIKGLNLKEIRDKRILPALIDGIKNGYGHYEGPYQTTLSLEEIYVDLITSRVKISQDNIEGVGVMLNLTKLKDAQKEIEHLAYYDELTQLPKRSVIIQNIENIISITKYQHIYSALLYFDLDKFKDINDSLGHNIGDKLLQHIAKMVKSVLRDEDIIARMGGDEFAVLLPMLSSNKEKTLQEAYKVAENILKAVSTPFSIDRIHFTNMCSLGIVIIDEKINNAYDAIKNADNAMYKAKNSKNSKIVIFDKVLSAEIEKKYKMKKRIEKALINHEFTLLYQPKFDKEKNITSAEVLLRWRDKDGNIIYPDNFLPIVLEFNMTEAITIEVINMVKQDLRKFSKNIEIAINIFGNDLYSKNIVDYIIKNLGDNASRIDLEITEQIFVSETNEAVENMLLLQKYGFLFSIDDFGTGYSSLSYLKKFPVDFIKIDKSFILDMFDNQSNYDIVITILAMTKSLGLKSIAEGVETNRHFEVLKSIGCDYFQGYYLSYPLEVDEFCKLIESTEE